MTTYQSLAPMTEEKAKFGYIQLTKSLKTYLYTFYRVVVCSSVLGGGDGQVLMLLQKFVSKNQTQNCLLGISAEEVLVIDAVTRETIDRYPFSQIRKWQVLHSFFSIFLQDHKEEYLTVEAETVSKVLFTHIHHALRVCNISYLSFFHLLPSSLSLRPAHHLFRSCQCFRNGSE